MINRERDTLEVVDQALGQAPAYLGEHDTFWAKLCEGITGERLWVDHVSRTTSDNILSRVDRHRRVHRCAIERPVHRRGGLPAFSQLFAIASLALLVASAGILWQRVVPGSPVPAQVATRDFPSDGTGASVVFDERFRNASPGAQIVMARVTLDKPLVLSKPMRIGQRIGGTIRPDGFTFRSPLILDEPLRLGADGRVANPGSTPTLGGS